MDIFETAGTTSGYYTFGVNVKFGYVNLTGDELAEKEVAGEAKVLIFFSKHFYLLKNGNRKVRKSFHGGKITNNHFFIVEFCPMSFVFCSFNKIRRHKKEVGNWYLDFGNERDNVRTKGKRDNHQLHFARVIPKNDDRICWRSKVIRFVIVKAQISVAGLIYCNYPQNLDS